MMSHTGAIRYADSETAERYPLTCRDDLHWAPKTGGFVASLEVGMLSEGSILIPSLSVLGQTYAFDATLVHQDARWHLPMLPSRPRKRCEPEKLPQHVSTHLDCFHVHAALENARLEFRVHCQQAPQRFLLTASWRPLKLSELRGPEAAVCCAPPPALSQMSQGGELAARICSPTCVAMVLHGFDAHVGLREVCDDCYDATSQLYGVWPNAIRAAATRGHLGATEALWDWSDAQRVLAVAPLVASIRFAAGELPGAPLSSTGGHLVVVFGASPECVVVNDPAAPDVATVPRTYDSHAFTRAWLQHRGAAYILLR